MRLSHGLMLTLGLGVTLAACSGGSSTPSGMNCLGSQANLPPAPQLLYPVPGASGVPDAVGILIYEGYGTSPNTITLFNGGQAPVATTPTTLPSTLPTPIASPSQPGTTYAVSFPVLTTNAIYQAQYALPAGCNPKTASFGSFTTF